MMRALDRFLQALAFLTILPVKALSPSSTDDVLFAYARDFSLAGIVIGLLSGCIYWLASLLWTGALPALLAIFTSLMVTGALHEDGLADTADGFGGGWTRDQRLAIMKDSRLGAYGVLALGLSIALKVCALSALSPGTALFALIAVHAVARFMPVLALAMLDYAGDPAIAKAMYSPERLEREEVLYALLWAVLAMLPILYLRPFQAFISLIFGGAMSLALMLYSKKALGGYCGDVLGAMEQFFEVGCLLGFATFSVGPLA
jgi:adenosylcobinamide-GDP ribazoletransferase